MPLLLYTARSDAGLCHVGFRGWLVAVVVVSGSVMANLTCRYRPASLVFGARYCSYYCCCFLLFSVAFCFVLGFWMLPHIYGAWYICVASKPRVCVLHNLDVNNICCFIENKLYQCHLLANLKME